MKEENLKVVSDIDGLQLDVLTEEPDNGSICGIIQLVHGMSEMKERYRPFMEYLTGLGFACIIHDHRGHGQSVKSKDDLGFLYGGGADALIEDTHQITETAKKRWPDQKLILFGHSMGALIVRCYLKKYDDELSALIISGAPCKNPAVGMGKLIVKFQKAVHGPRYKSKLLNDMSFGSYGKNFPNEGSEYAWLSVDQGNVKAYEESEYCGFPFTVDGYEGLMDLLSETYNNKNWQVKNPKLPILFVSGKDDPCTNGPRNLKIAIDHLRSLGYCDIRGKLYEGGRHEILNDTMKKTVYSDITKWLKQKDLLKDAAAQSSFIHEKDLTDD